VKTLFVAYRVTDLDRSLDFYTALGYVELGRVEGGDGARAALAARRRRGSPTRMATGSSWWSGRLDTPTASPPRTSPERSSERSQEASLRHALVGPAWVSPLAIPLYAVQPLQSGGRFARVAAAS
jgi:catechol 2,3-dioxygenase-like lactoylglutathione lyase family enzyme